jgi:hypothetical protein
VLQLVRQPSFQSATRELELSRQLVGSVPPATTLSYASGATEVLVSDPRHELVHRWCGHMLRWTLTPTRDGSRLTLETTFDERADRGMYAAGRHLCLAMLAAVLDGHDLDRVVGSHANDYGWSALRDRYDANFG